MDKYYYEIDVYADGSSQPNPGPSGFAIYIVDTQTGNPLLEECFYIGQNTIVKAEYLAMIYALEIVRKKFTCRKVNVFSDNLVAVKQANKLFKVKTSSLNKYFLKIRQLSDNYFREGVEFLHTSEATGKKSSFQNKWHKICDKNAKKVVKTKIPFIDINNLFEA
jgi:ribonuclease HI